MAGTSERIYADHAATTPARPEVVQAMLPYFGESGFNPSSLHAEGRRARAGVDDARDTIARCLGVKAKEIVITGSGSEADNLAIFGAARALAHRGKHIVSTRVEHHAVLNALEVLAADGWEVGYLETDQDGRVDPQDFSAALRDDTVLATIMLANNELGTLQPVADLAAVARARGVLFHTDAVQAPALLKVEPAGLGVDLLSLSAHKFYGPKGVGALYVKDGTPLLPHVVGGAQEFAKRAGTENVAGIVGMAKALELAVAERAESAPRMTALRDRFEGHVAALDDIRINGGTAPRLPNISNVSFAGVDADALVMRLDLEGAAVSTGSACAAGSLEPSHVIAALGLDARWQRCAVRFSFGRTTTREQVDRLGTLVNGIVAELRRFSTRGTH